MFKLARVFKGGTLRQFFSQNIFSSICPNKLMGRHFLCLANSIVTGFIMMLITVLGYLLQFLVCAFVAFPL